MSLMSSSENTFLQGAGTYGGLVDAIGGIVTVVLAIIALAGVHQEMFVAIATVVFAAALLIEGGTMLSEYAGLSFPAGTLESAGEFGRGGGLSAIFLAGGAGIVLGVLALVGIYTVTLSAVAVIAFGGAVILGSNSVWQLHRMKQISYRMEAPHTLSGGEILANEVASGAAVMQGLAGLAAVVLGIVAVTGTLPVILALIGLLVLGAAILLTGSTLSSAVTSLMEPAVPRRGEGRVQAPAE